MVVGFLIFLASYLLTIPEAKFGEARLLFIVVFRAPVYILLPLFYDDTNTFY